MQKSLVSPLVFIRILAILLLPVLVKLLSYIYW